MAFRQPSSDFTAAAKLSARALRDNKSMHPEPSSSFNSVFASRPNLALNLAEGVTAAAAAKVAVSNDAGFLGLVMLASDLLSLPGDLDHPDTFGVPTGRRIVTGAWPDQVVQSAAGLRAGRVAMGLTQVLRAMEKGGARAITTSCSFLVLLQKELQAAVRVPVVTSSLLQLPGLLASQAQVGVLTITAGKLGREHLRAAGVPRERLKDVLIQGVKADGEFALALSALAANRAAMDIEKAATELAAAAMALRQRAPELQFIVLECSRMAPHRLVIESASGLKTLSLADDVRLLRPWRSV